MSKSKRVFLTIMGDDDFWGNGDRMEGGDRQYPMHLTRREQDEEYYYKEKIEKDEEEGKSEEEEDEDEEDDDYHSTIGDISNVDYALGKLRTSSESTVDSGKEEGTSSYFSVNRLTKSDKTYSDEEKSDLKDSGAASVDSNDDAYHVGFRTFLQNRPEAEIRAFLDGPFDVLDDKFYEAYEQVRKQLETSPYSNVVQQLRRTTPTASEQRIRSKHAVVVSNFREPDRRLGRYSKYYYHHNVGPEVYSRKVFVGGLPACVSEVEILTFFSRFGRLQVDWPSKHYATKSDSDPSYSSSHHHQTSPDESPTRQPTSHLALSHPPFGQINPFVTDFSMSSLASNANDVTSQIDSCNSSGREKRQQHLGYVFLLFEKERSVRDLVTDCFEEEEGLFISLEDCSSLGSVRVQIRPWLLADAEFLMDFNVPINTKLVAFIGGVPRPLKAVELAHFFEQTYGHVVCVGIDIDNKFKYPRGSGRVAFSNYEAYVQAITDRYIVLDHEDIHKRVEIKPYFFHNQSCEECSGRYHRQYAPFFCPSLECFQYYCESCWHKMHAHPSRFHHMPVIKGV